MREQWISRPVQCRFGLMLAAGLGQAPLTNNNCNIIWEPGIYTNIADFNLHGIVNFKDFADFADVWLWQAKL
ncbi:MAG: hypothetical protein ACYS30_15915 [Planctomycetota bacterium]